MPRKVETNAERAERMSRNALELQHRDKRLTVQRLMFESPDLVPKIKDFLISIGAWSGSGNASGAPRADGDSVAGTPKKSADSNNAGAGAGNDDPAPNGDASPPKATSTPPPPNRNFGKMENMPLVHLRGWLTKMEPISCSEAQLKVLVKRGSRDASREGLSQLIEYMTNLDPSAPLFNGGNRSDETMAKFAAGLEELNNSLGRRARELRLPPAWSKDGFYHVKQFEGKAYLEHKFNKRVAPIPQEVVDKVGIEGLSVELNFSENRAYVTAGPGSLGAWLCKEILDAAPKCLEPPRKRPKTATPQLALSDRPWAPQHAEARGEEPPATRSGEGAQTAASSGDGSTLAGVPEQENSREQPSAGASGSASGKIDQLSFVPPADA